MSLEATVKRRIEMNRKRMAALSGNVLREQELGFIEEETMLLERLLDVSKEPVVEQQVNVRLTLSVDVSISKQNIKERILSYLGQSDGITTMSIEIEEEAEIYNNG